METLTLARRLRRRTVIRKTGSGSRAAWSVRVYAYLFCFVLFCTAFVLNWMDLTGFGGEEAKDLDEHGEMVPDLSLSDRLSIDFG